MNTNDLLASLGKVGKLFYDKMIDRLNSGNYPPGETTKNRKLFSIQDATSVTSPSMEGNIAKVEIRIDLNKAPYAGAYEEGSGLHGPEKDTYEIVPRKEDGEMVFPPEDWPQWQDYSDIDLQGASPRDGLFFLTHVNHPGVKKKPYIAPTIKAIHEEVRKILAQDFKEMVLRDGKTMEIIK